MSKLHVILRLLTPFPNYKKMNQVGGTKIVSESLMFNVANELFVNPLCKETLYHRYIHDCTYILLFINVNRFIQLHTCM